MQILVLVELVDHSLSVLNGRRAIHAAIVEARQRADKLLKDVQHDPMLREEKRLMTRIFP